MIYVALACLATLDENLLPSNACKNAVAGGKFWAVSQVVLIPSLRMLLLLSPLLLGCAAHQRARVVIPKRCVSISVQSFTRPCVQQNNGKIVCDGVVITATCVELR